MFSFYQSLFEENRSISFLVKWIQTNIQTDKFSKNCKKIAKQPKKAKKIRHFYHINQVTTSK
jgi:hypothetical protein